MKIVCGLSRPSIDKNDFGMYEFVFWGSKIEGRWVDYNEGEASVLIAELTPILQALIAALAKEKFIATLEIDRRGMMAVHCSCVVLKVMSPIKGCPFSEYSERVKQIIDLHFAEINKKDLVLPRTSELTEQRLLREQQQSLMFLAPPKRSNCCEKLTSTIAALFGYRP